MTRMEVSELHEQALMARHTGGEWDADAMWVMELTESMAMAWHWPQHVMDLVEV